MSPQSLISVIDDDASVRTAVVSLLRSLGLKGLAFDSAEAFLESGELESTKLVITDIHMPGMSGIDLKRQLDARGSTVPVIMITAKTEPSVLERARACNPSCLLKKPFDSDEFIACVERALAS
ncbi:response regulator transcription factor [Vitiosangium sp. GDMCC 1.1324]|uniref:response regulator transcription factor n=1 Tax=Vitiosangium sp. (strain GDMCC 1.1324) TaxID=2138576 RepID=UPI000D377598|nr:response regulator [Vitiosangium sp. GDMCC 1.1324]PTL76504.1 response regulator [Vitiosangium sp. GDMCC 1.1324]